MERRVEKEIGREYIRKCDVGRRFPYDAYEKAAKLGWMRLFIPKEDGGDGANVFDYALMCEALALYGRDFRTAVSASTYNAMTIIEHGTPEQKKQYIEPFIQGKIRICISISEHAPSRFATTLGDEMDEIMAVDGGELGGNTPAQFREFIAMDTSRWRKIVKDAGIPMQ